MTTQKKQFYRSKKILLLEEEILNRRPENINHEMISEYLGPPMKDDQIDHFWWSHETYEVSHGPLRTKKGLYYTTLYMIETSRTCGMKISSFNRDNGPAEVTVYSDGMINLDFWYNNKKAELVNFISNSYAQRENFHYSIIKKIEKTIFSYAIKDGSTKCVVTDFEKIPKDLSDRFVKIKLL